MNPSLILVVEDNPTTRKMVRLALLAEGFSVLEAQDGESALRIFADRAPALVLLDCKLPDIDGFDVARRMRAQSASLPIIAVTGWAQADEAHVLTAGFLDVIEKPIEPSRLIEIVTRHVGHAPPRAPHVGRFVILADDDPTQRKLGQLALLNAGFEVVAAKDGAAAVQLAKQRTPDAIVSDVLMPGLDGFAVCKAIRAEPSLATVPIVLISAHYLEDQDRELAARFGATRYVSRTVGFDAIVRTVIDAIEVRAGSVTPQDSDLQAEYLQRIAHQLERQAAIGSGLARRVSLQATALTVLDRLSDSLSRQLDPENALAETLSDCLDAAGLSVGAILLLGSDGRLTMKAHVGSTVEAGWDEHAEILREAVRKGALILRSSEGGRAGDALLATLGAASCFLVPIIARDEPLGVLLLGSNGTDLASLDGESFVRAARSLSTQLGQALALSRTFSKLAAAEQRYRALLENARDAIGILSTDGVILEANRGWEEITGLPREQLVGRNITEFTVDADRGMDHENAIVDSNGLVPPALVRRADRRMVHVEVSRTLVEVGSERYILSIGRDVSERLRLEEQLRQAQKMEAVGRLAGGVAHDFNNVLSVILSYGELLLADVKPGDPIRDDICEITKAGRRGAELTSHLLAFSRQQVIEPKVIDLNDVLTTMEKMLERILGEDIELVSRAGEGLWRVRVDPGSVEQVIMNLVVNARDAMPKGGKLTIETRNVVLDEEYARAHVGVTPGPYVLVAIADTGVGMDTVTRARIFEPFFTTKGKGHGTGLGLSTVFGIVRQSGGTVWVETEPGKGATFEVYLPRVDAAVDARGSSPPSEQRRGSEAILLVEDDEQVRTVARGILRRNGYEVIEACNAGEALLYSEQHNGTIHLLLTDVVMPHVSGPELAKRLAKNRPDMKVLCMSGYTDDSIAYHGVSESGIAYLQKPITPEAFLRKVREVLDGPTRGATRPLKG